MQLRGVPDHHCEMKQRRLPRLLSPLLWDNATAVQPNLLLMGAQAPLPTEGGTSGPTYPFIEDTSSAKKEYSQFTAWCEDRAASLGFEIKTG